MNFFNQNLETLFVKCFNRKKLPNFETKITDMNHDCIEYILELLSFVDLLNVAQSNEILGSVSCTIFSRRYLRRKNWLFLEGTEFRRNLECAVWKHDVGAVFKPRDVRTGLKVLRHFGHFFPSIRINYCNMSLKERQLIEQLLSENCENSKMNLVLVHCPEDALKWIKKPLKNVHDIKITGQTNLNFDQLNNKFPNMKILKLDWVQVPDGQCIELKFPALNNLYVEIRDRTMHFTEDNVLITVLLNPQLKHIMVKLHPHPQLNPTALIDHLENNFKGPGKNAEIIQL